MRSIVVVILVLVLLSACASSQPVKKQTYSAEVHKTLGLAYIQEGNATRALKEFLLAVEGDPQNPEIHAGLAQAYYMKKAYPLAEEHFLEALELSQGNPQYRNNLGALYLDMQRWDDAIHQFRLASDNLLFASPEIALTGMGVAQASKGDYYAAVESYKLALSANIQFPQAYFYLGESYDALDKLDLAVEAFKRATKLVPNYLDAHYRLGMLYMRRKESALAKTEFDKVMILAPDSEQARLSSTYLILLK